MNVARLKFFVENLVKLSFNNDGLLDDGKISAIVQVLKEQSLEFPLQRVLSLYLNKLKEALSNTTLVIEYSDRPSENVIERIKGGFEKMCDRKLQVLMKQNNELIAGLRVTCADEIFEYSVAATLEAYKKSLMG